MSVISMKQLLEAGVHFGHQTRRWNPKMDKYIYTSRGGIHIIDLQKTVGYIDEAYAKLLEIGKNNGKILFVGTKKQAQDVVKEEAIRSGQFYVSQRWLGGTLTNFKTIRKSIRRLHDIARMEKDGTFTRLPKKEVLGLRKELEKLEKFLSGIKDMRTLPQAVFVVDPMKEKNAVLEARKLKIPVFGIVDTNCDPDLVDVIIPANDDAIRSVKLIVGKLANAFIVAAGGEVIETIVEPVVRPPYTGPKKPYAGDKKPYNGPKKPYAGDKKPFNKDRKPYVAATPDTTAGKTIVPAAKVTTPAVKETTPVVKVEKAAVKEAKPVVKVEKAVVKETKAVVKETKPAAKETKPVVKVEKAVVKETKAVVKETKPVAKETKPAAKKAKPTVKKAKPVEKVDAKASVDLKTLKVTELRALAKEKGLTGYSKLVKADLINALK